MFISSYYAYEDDYEKSLAIYPFNTEVKVKLSGVYWKEDKLKAYNLAEDIIKQNEYVLNAYIIKRDYEYEKHDINQAINSAERVMLLNPLNMDHVETYGTILLAKVNDSIEKGDKQSALINLEKITDILSDVSEQHNVEVKVYITSIFDEKSLIEMFSDGIRQLIPVGILNQILDDFREDLGLNGVILFDLNFFVIGPL